MHGTAKKGLFLQLNHLPHVNIPTIVGLLQKSMFCANIKLEYPKKDRPIEV